MGWRRGQKAAPRLDFSALSDSGSVALTPISAYTFSHEEATMPLRARMTGSERKYVIVRKSNPLSVLQLH